MKEYIDGLYKNHAMNSKDTYEMNIERLKSSLNESTNKIFSDFNSLDSQCGPRMRYEKYKSINILHIYIIPHLKM
tara:strand:- start:8708 stop:8932 length:225 start_codon:yes stop_codon:yes gene_type:complete